MSRLTEAGGGGRPAAQPLRSGERLAGIDAMRLVAFCAVCLIHGSRWGAADRYDTGWAGWISLACRFAVPFYFLTSGYLLAGSWRPLAEDLRRSGGRIASVFLFWALLYVAATPGGLPRLTGVRFDLALLLTGGPAYPLWFLPALLVGVFAARTTLGWPAVVRGALAAVFLLAGWLAAAWWGWKDAPHAGRYLSAMGYVMTGALWRTHGGPSPRPQIAWLLIAAGLCAQPPEAWLCDALRLRPVGDLEFALGAAPLGFGVFLAALRWRAAGAAARIFAEIGRGALGLFAAHLGVLMLLFDMLPHGTLAERLWTCAVAIACTVLMVSLMRATPLRRFVE